MPHHTPDAASRPFVTAPDADRYFPSAVAEEARQRIGRAIARGEGPCLLIGPAGVGKSLLLEVLAREFGDHMAIVPLAGAQICTRRALHQMILFQLELPFREMDECELRLSLLSYLRPNDASTRKIALLVDEADSLPVRLLEELRVLTNVANGGQSLVHLVLAGCPQLEEHFADPQLTGFSQRVSARCYLSALGREETFQYVRAQIAAVGLNPDALITQDGLESIFAATDGVPRLVNQLGDQLVLIAQETGATPLDGTTVQQAWSELQQLPAPWNTPKCEPEFAESVVEFGELSAGDVVFENDDRNNDNKDNDDTDDDHPASIPITRQHEKDQNLLATFDTADHLLAQLEDETTSDAPQGEVSTTAIAQARNPFDESFESEEILLDRYSNFESQLLANAPQVINRLDTAFACQLRALETVSIESHEIANDSLSTVSPQELDDVVLHDFDTELDLEEKSDSASVERSKESVAEVVADDVCLTIESSPNSSPGDVLVIEDGHRSPAEIVPGSQFRQLFSRLESSELQSGLG